MRPCTALLSITPAEGTLRRYERGALPPRLTHQFTAFPNALFEEGVTDAMLFDPPEHLRVAEGDTVEAPEPTPMQA